MLSFFSFVVKGTVEFSKEITVRTLRFAEDTVGFSLQTTDHFLQFLSNLFYPIYTWRAGLQSSSLSVRLAAKDSIRAMKIARVFSEKHLYRVGRVLINHIESANHTLYHDKAISSIVGSVHNDFLGLSKIEMSLRKDGKDQLPTQILTDYQKFEMNDAILYLSGLFGDEDSWRDFTYMKDRRLYTSPGIADFFIRKGYYGMYIRYNQGLHVSHNGKKLMNILDGLLSGDSLPKLNIITYSLGGLVLRSALYYAKKEKKTWLHKIGKVIMVGSPDNGSYLEKLGYWATVLAEMSPLVFLKLFGIVGNMRSDGIKDLSHGIIREEDWLHPNQIIRYTKENYFGELDEIDAYQIYTIVGEAGSWNEFFGDGIIERTSQTYLTDRVFRKKSNPTLRSQELRSLNHFSILFSQVLLVKLAEIFTYQTE
jgi:pimeloyl-ACP methyl ester carboxylesterase